VSKTAEEGPKNEKVSLALAAREVEATQGAQRRTSLASTFWATAREPQLEHLVDSVTETFIVKSYVLIGDNWLTEYTMNCVYI